MRYLMVAALALAACNASAPHAPLTGGWWHGAPLEQRYEQVGIRFDASMEPYAGIVLDGAQAWRSFGIDFVVDETEARTLRCADESTFADGIFAWTDGTGIRFRCSTLATSLTGQDANEDARYQEQKVIGAAHELGHYLGLEHVQEEAAVMNAGLGPNTQQAFLQADVDVFYAARGEAL